MSGSGADRTGAGVDLAGPKVLRLANVTDRFAP
jgi:hypothetical protein